MMPPADWSEYQKLVMAELERHNEVLEGLSKQINDIHIEIAMLKVKSGLWGAAAGFLAVALQMIISFVLR